MSDKINAMVAEKVMGWVEMDRHTAYRDTHNYELTGWWHRPNGETTHRSERFGDEAPWSPSTDISAAWAVVEKMGNDGFTCDIQWKGGGRMHEHTAETGFSTGLALRGYGCGTAPVSICLAALRAVGVPEHEIREAMQ